MNKMKFRPDLPDKKSPGHIRVVQLTDEPGVPSSHVYMEAQVFSSDSKRFLLHRAAYAHGPSGTGPNGTTTSADKRKFKDDPEHQYLLCDIENDCALSPLIAETGAIAPSIYADKYAYYFIDRTEVGGGSLELKRVNLDGAGRQTVMVIDAAIPGTNYHPSFIYPLSTISSDGRRMALSCFLGDGSREKIAWGLMIFDLEKASVRLVMEGPSWCNMHPQYCRSTDPEGCHDVLVQENHGNITGPDGAIQRLTGEGGADIHVIRDDGTNFRDMPWGRDGNEYCQGHQCWRGNSAWAITSTRVREPKEGRLIESAAVASADHAGLKTPGGIRNDLSRDFPQPYFWHFATDAAGRRLITDFSAAMGPECSLYIANLDKPGSGPAGPFTYLLCPRCNCAKNSHLHPFLSPDGRYGFFNSDESGILQAYMIMFS